MYYTLRNLQHAYYYLEKFRRYSVSKHHERYLFPYICGTYFSYRKVDILRIKTIADKISKEIRRPIKYLEVGCGNGDFLEKIREYITNAKGIENNIDLIYYKGNPKPKYIELADARDQLDGFNDIIFVGWMDPGQDYRKNIAEATDIIITTLDCGLSLSAEYEEFGFKNIAKWTTPSWDDVNIEISNHFYSNLELKTLKFLSSLRGAHNFWYIYSKDNLKHDLIVDALKQQEQLEENMEYNIVPYDFETILDQCGFPFHQKLENHVSSSEITLWKIDFL